MRELKWLTSLRFLAAFYVFVFHLNKPHRTPLTYLPGRVQTLIQEGRLAEFVTGIVGALLVFRLGWRVPGKAAVGLLLLNILGGALLYELVEKRAHAFLMDHYQKYQSRQQKPQHAVTS